MSQDSVARANLFLMGGPKCGTTSLANWLSQHSEVYLSYVKEPRYFNSDWRLPNSPGSLKEYEQFFKAAKGEKWLCDATTGYLVSDVAAHKIRVYNPFAKYLVCLRNPIDMAISLHAQRLKEGVETERCFWAAWCLQEERACLSTGPAGFADYQQLQYGKICKTGCQTERLLSAVDSRAVHIISFNDLKESPEFVLARVLAFLGLDVEADISLDHVNKGHVPKHMLISRLNRVIGLKMRSIGIKGGLGIQTKINKMNQVPYQKSKLSEEQFSTILAYFEKNISGIETLLGKKFPEWRCHRVHLG